MDSELAKKYESLSTEQLVAIAFLESKDYRDEAIEAAKEVLASRGVTPDASTINNIEEDLQRRQDATDAEPLPKKGRIIYFICGWFFVPWLAALLYISYHKDKWGKRRAKEAQRWLMVGLGTMFLFWMSLYAILWICGFARNS